MKIEILTRNESVKYLISFQQQETTEIKNRIRTALGDVSQIQAGVDIKKLLAQKTVSDCSTQRWLQRYATRREHGHPTKEHERMLQSAQRKMLRLIILTKRRYKKIVKHKVKNSEDMNEIDSSCTNDESEDGKSDTSHHDQDSDVSFEIGNDEEIDAAEIEEEEWVEYIERSTIEVMEKMENEKT